MSESVVRKTWIDYDVAKLAHVRRNPRTGVVDIFSVEEGDLLLLTQLRQTWCDLVEVCVKRSEVIEGEKVIFLGLFRCTLNNEVLSHPEYLDFDLIGSQKTGYLLRVFDEATGVPVSFSHLKNLISLK